MKNIQRKVSDTKLQNGTTVRVLHTEEEDSEYHSIYPDSVELIVNGTEISLPYTLETAILLHEIAYTISKTELTKQLSRVADKPMANTNSN